MANGKEFRLLSERELNILRGKAMVGAITADEALGVLNHLTELEYALDKADYDDALGTEGWRHFVGMPDAD